MLRSRLVAALALAALAGAFGGCAGGSEAGGPEEAGPTIATAAEPEAPSLPAEPATTETTLRDAPTLGKGFSYEAGLRVRIGKPERFQPSPWIEPQAGIPLAFTVVVHNDTDEEWNPSQLHVRLQVGFQPASQIYDAEQGIVARPEERVPAGRTVRFRVAYWAPEQGGLTVEFSPGFGYQATTVNG